MKITVKGHHATITKALREYAEKKLDKLARFFDQIQEIVVDLSLANASNENETHIASATIFASGAQLHAEESTKSMYASIDGLVDKLEVQLKKYKSKRKEHRVVPERILTAKSATSKKSAPSKERFIAKPLEIEEAVRILTEEKLNFLIFRNLENERISVIHSPKKGELEVIEVQ